MSLSRLGLCIARMRMNRLNNRVNKLFKQLNLPLRYMIQMDHYGRTYLFGVAVNKESTNDEIIQIIQSTPESSWYGRINFFGEWIVDNFKR